MLGWVYLIGVLLAIAAIVYLDRGSIGRGHIDIREADIREADVREIDVREEGPSTRASSISHR